ncbi:unnamed protein product [Clonostachys chloroleuca]|uniref:Peptidase C14 caspase domain-containing protein n=1 Tax=Clonostachys chloroleuca TaxID=1926264 RepID=A0AA35Q8D6_9HYPO|nr:unnamed protein product [Clonostachys chloroleuca]
MSFYPAYNGGGYGAPPQAQHQQQGKYYSPQEPNYDIPTQGQQIPQPVYAYQQPPQQQQYIYAQQAPPQQQFNNQAPSIKYSNRLPTHGQSSAPYRPPTSPTAPQHFGRGAPSGYDFHYSNCTGRRKALLIGINYFGQDGQLRGCINDIRNMTAYLVEHFGYRREDMVILTDDKHNPTSQPSKQNILRAMHWLVKGSMPNDSLILHYSGKNI